MERDGKLNANGHLPLTSKKKAFSHTKKRVAKTGFDRNIFFLDSARVRNRFLAVHVMKHGREL